MDKYKNLPLMPWAIDVDGSHEHDMTEQELIEWESRDFQDEWQERRDWNEDPDNDPEYVFDPDDQYGTIKY